MLRKEKPLLPMVGIPGRTDRNERYEPDQVPNSEAAHKLESLLILNSLLLGSSALRFPAIWPGFSRKKQYSF
jgi:hypothetical protein